MRSPIHLSERSSTRSRPWSATSATKDAEAFVNRGQILIDWPTLSELIDTTGLEKLHSER
jgi:hypothetical protein